jgi:hypothetical protein
MELIYMKYLINVIDDTPNSATDAEMADIDVFNDRLVAEGHWVLAGGLTAPDGTTLIDNRGGKQLVTDGPFIESKEYVSGFWVIEAEGIDKARELATAGSEACNRRVELRPFLVI